MPSTFVSYVLHSFHYSPVMLANISSVLIADPVDAQCVSLLKNWGLSVTTAYKLPLEQLLAEVKNHDGLVVRSETKVTRQVFEASPRLKVVGRAGTGVDNIDLEAATDHGVIVLNTPGGNSISACELTCALISGLARKIGGGYMSLKEGRWDRKLYMGSELSGKTLAVLGLGRIGREVAKRMQSFGMHTVGFDPMVDHETCRLMGIEKMKLDEIWPVADYITVHTPLIPQTKNLINDESLSKCKKGVKIVNVARGGIVDEAALLKAIKDGRCGGAGLDVFTEEPPKSQHVWDLVKHPAVLATPHLGASTEEAQTRVAVEVAEQIIALKDPASGFEVTGAVNAPSLAALRDASSEPWLRLSQAMGRLVGSVTSKHPINRIHLDITTSGNMESMKFVVNGAKEGVLQGRGDSEVNSVNCVSRAKKAGLPEPEYQHQISKEASYLELTVNISGQTHVLLGVVSGNNLCLVKINEAVFLNQTCLTERSRLFRTDSQHCQNACIELLGAFQKSGASVLNTALGLSKNICWILIEPNINLKSIPELPHCQPFI